jgi:tetratricopeptide (TPR) repeat protein
MEARLVNITSLLIVIAVTVGGGCDTPSKRAAEQVRQADRAYRVARYEESERIASDVIRTHPDELFASEALYLRGLSRLRRGERNAAENDFLAALRRCDHRPLKALLWVQLGNMAFDDERHAAAARSYGRAVEDLPANVSAEKVWFQYGVSLQRNGEFKRARVVFGRLLAEHPSSALASSARRKLAWRHDHFSVQCGAFSSEENARSAARALREGGVNAAVARRDLRSAYPFVVLAGRFRNFGAAESALADVRRIQGDAFIVP